MPSKGEAATQGESINDGAGDYKEENAAADATAPAAEGAVAAPRAVVLERADVLRQVKWGAAMSTRMLDVCRMRIAELVFCLLCDFTLLCGVFVRRYVCMCVRSLLRAGAKSMQ